MDQADDISRAVARGEEDVTLDHGRDERGHRLAEHVAERQQIQEADGLEGTHVFAVFLDTVVDGFQVARMLRCEMVTPFGSPVRRR